MASQTTEIKGWARRYQPPGHFQEQLTLMTVCLLIPTYFHVSEKIGRRDVPPLASPDEANKHAI